MGVVRRALCGHCVMGRRKCCCSVDCDLCALDVFSGGDPTSEVIRVTGADWSSSCLTCTPFGGSGAGALLGSTASSIDHDVPYSHDLPNGCPVYILTNVGTGDGETGQIVVTIGTNTTLCGTSDCTVIMTYNPGAQMQRIYEYSGGSWSSCRSYRTAGTCDAAGCDVGIMVGSPSVLP